MFFGIGLGAPNKMNRIFYFVFDKAVWQFEFLLTKLSHIVFGIIFDFAAQFAEAFFVEVRFSYFAL